MDNLSDKAIYPPDGITPPGYVSAAEVRRAALTLQLNPNAMRERCVLLAYYSYFANRPLINKNNSDDDYFSVIQALAAGRIARGIHQYDRYKHIFQGFLMKCFRFAEKELHDILAKDELHAKQLLAALSSKPDGRWAKFPRRVEIKDEVTNKKSRASKPYFLLEISDEELEEIIEYCNEQQTPVSAGYMLKQEDNSDKENSLSKEEKQDIFNRFEQWWRSQKTRIDIDFALFIFELEFIHDYDRHQILTAAAADRWPDADIRRVDNILSSQSRKKFREFLESEIRN